MKRFRNSDYYVTQNGKVFRKTHVGYKERKLNLNKETGYIQIQLYIDRKYKNFLIHRMVAECYLNGFTLDDEIHHIDEDRSNNNAFNLEIAPYKDKNSYKDKKNPYQILIVNERLGIFEIVDTHTEANEIVGYKYRSGINSLLKNSSKNRNGFKLRKMYK